MFTHILLPTDGSEQCRKAIDGALELARATGCRLTAYTCIEEFPNMAYSAGVGECPHAYYMETVQGYAKECIERIAERAREEIVVFTLKYKGFPLETHVSGSARPASELRFCGINSVPPE